MGKIISRQDAWTARMNEDVIGKADRDLQEETEITERKR
jgi:hypothetical protein